MAVKILIEKFDSLSSYLDTIEKRPVNKIFCRHRTSNKNELPSHITADSSWIGSESYEASCEIIRNGFREGFEKMMAEKVDLKYATNYNRELSVSDVVGFAPHVPNAIAGVPHTMINKRSVSQPGQKVIDIMYLMTANASVSCDELIKAGAKAMSLVNSLELKGYRCGLWAGDSFCGSNQYMFNIVRIKHQRQQSNMLKVSYPLSHPSWLRRQSFAWLETVPGLEEDITCGYGRPFHQKIESYTERVKFLHEHGVLDNKTLYLDYDIIQKNSVEELAKLIGINHE